MVAFHAMFIKAISSKNIANISVLQWTCCTEIMTIFPVEVLLDVQWVRVVVSGTNGIVYSAYVCNEG